MPAKSNKNAAAPPPAPPTPQVPQQVQRLMDDLKHWKNASAKWKGRGAEITEKMEGDEAKLQLHQSKLAEAEAAIAAAKEGFAEVIAALTADSTQEPQPAKGKKDGKKQKAATETDEDTELKKKKRKAMLEKAVEQLTILFNSTTSDGHDEVLSVASGTAGEGSILPPLPKKGGRGRRSTPPRSNSLTKRQIINAEDLLQYHPDCVPQEMFDRVVQLREMRLKAVKDAQQAEWRLELLRKKQVGLRALQRLTSYATDSSSTMTDQVQGRLTEEEAGGLVLPAIK
eukprot:Sspe_Gene.42240::Locus_20504_Transcript_2_2_Confidence_0.667_Length_1400::g.42240::m.42240